MQNSKVKVLALGFLLAAGFLLRIIPIVTDSVHFSFDQGLDIILVKQLVVDHKISLISRYSGLSGVLMGPLWTWFLAVPFAVSGGNPAANVAWMAVLSVASSLATYLILRKIFGEAVAWLTFFWTLFSPYFVAHSQVVLSPHPLTYLFIFYIWFLYEITINKKTVFWLPLGLLVGLFFQLEIAFALFTVPAAVAAGFALGQGKVLVNKHFVFGMILLAVTFLPQILFDLRHDFLMTKSLLNFAGSGSNSLYKETLPLFLRFGERAKSFGEDFVGMTVGAGNLGVLAGAVGLALLGWARAMREKEGKFIIVIKIITIITVIFYLGFSFYPGPLWGWYRQGLPIVYVLLLTIPAGHLWEKGKAVRPVIFFGGLVLLYQFINPAGVISALQNKNGGGVGSLGEQKKIIDDVYSSAAGQPFSYFAYTPPVYDYIWQYNFWWYGQKKYGYLPKNWQMGVPLLGIGKQIQIPARIEGLYYLVIEPDTERPWGPVEWRKQFAKYGNASETRNFGGIVLEIGR